ncbi:hypothetical protein V8C26DRAFT_428955 [Trichoderma gracile]
MDGDLSPDHGSPPVPIKVDLSTVHEAAAATEAEHNMGFVKSLQLYWKACLWSIFISTCIIMDRFDTALLRSLFAYPAFRRQFGIQQANGTYQLTAAWQSGLANGGTDCGTTYWDLSKGVNARRTEIVCMVWMGQTLSGSNFMGYSTYCYQQAGLAVSSSFSMSLGQYGIGIVGTIQSWFLMARFGRRTLFLTDQACACLIFFTIGCASFVGSANAGAQWGIGSLLLVYTFVYDSSVGPICYSLVAELTSTRLRATSVVLARNMYNIASIIANILTRRMLNPTAWGWGARTGFFWAGTALCCATWTFFRLPEPKGRAYGELDTLFEQGVSARRFATTAVGRIGAGFVSVSIAKDGGSTAEIERIATKT